MEDQSRGWDAIAMDFVAARSEIGTGIVRQWARSLRPGGDVVDIGCGSGVPVSQALVDQGFAVFGIDASPTLLSMFRQRFPDARAACEPVQNSAFFSHTFDGAIAIGLLFLLAESEQKALIAKVGQVLRPGARFLFSAPRERCAWRDMQTGRLSKSLGTARYEELLAGAGMRLEATRLDEGGNHYLDAVLNVRSA